MNNGVSGQFRISDSPRVVVFTSTVGDRLGHDVFKNVLGSQFELEVVALLSERPRC